jgi:multiple sugar transport system substrate-binding protein
MKKMKTVLFVLLALVLLASVAGCAPSAPAPTAAPAAPAATTAPAAPAATTAPAAPAATTAPAAPAAGATSADKGEIVVWAWSESEIKGLAERFNKVYPNITVKFVALDSDAYVAKFQNSLATGGDLPDVALQEVSVRGAMVALDAWENLEAAPYNFDRNTVYPQILPTMMNPKGEIVGIERELNPSGICYKRDLAEKYLGTQDPDALAAKLSDWDKFIAAGAQIAKDTNGKVQLMAGLGDLQRILVNQYDKPVFDGDTAKATEFFKYNLDIMIRMVKGGMMGKLDTYSPAWNSSYVDKDNYIIYPCAPWSPVWIVKANDPDSKGRWGITAAPLHGYSFGGTAYGIPKGAKNKDLAWDFIKWATTTDDGTKACEDVVGAIVSRQATYKNGYSWKPDPYFGDQIPNQVLMEKAAPTMKIRPMSQYDVVLNDVLTLVEGSISNNPNITLDDAVKQAVTEMKNKLPPEMKVE